MWSALGALGGAALNSVGSLGQSALSWYFSKKAADLSYKYQEKLAKNRPSWNKEGLERAGYNPILAINGGAAGGAGAGLNVTAPQGGDPAGAALAGAASAAGIASAFAQKDKTEAETDLTKSNKKGQDLANQGTKIENANKKIAGKLLEAQAAKEVAQTQLFENSANKIFNEDMGIQYDNIIKSFNAAGYQDFVKENPTAIKEALAGEYGAKAQALAKEISSIAKNWSSVASNATDLIPVKKLPKLISDLLSKMKIGKKK